MPVTIMYESDFYRIEVDASQNLLVAHWLRAVSDDELRTGGMMLYEVLCKTKVEHVVANAQKLGTLSTESKGWMSNTFYDLLSQTSLKKLARALPENKFRKLALESVVTRAEALNTVRFQVKNCTDQQEALAWLQQE